MEILTALVFILGLVSAFGKFELIEYQYTCSEYLNTDKFLSVILKRSLTSILMQ